MYSLNFPSCILIDNTKPSITNPTDYPAEGRDIVTLNCTEVSNDAVTYVWYKKTNGGNYEKISETGNLLDVGKSGSAGNGEYKCEVNGTNANVVVMSEAITVLFYCKFLTLHVPLNELYCLQLSNSFHVSTYFNKQRGFSIHSTIYNLTILQWKCLNKFVVDFETTTRNSV